MVGKITKLLGKKTKDKEKTKVLCGSVSKKVPMRSGSSDRNGHWVEYTDVSLLLKYFGIDR